MPDFKDIYNYSPHLLTAPAVPRLGTDTYNALRNWSLDLGTQAKQMRDQYDFNKTLNNDALALTRLGLENNPELQAWLATQHQLAMQGEQGYAQAMSNIRNKVGLSPELATQVAPELMPEYLKEFEHSLGIGQTDRKFKSEEKEKLALAGLHTSQGNLANEQARKARIEGDKAQWEHEATKRAYQDIINWDGTGPLPNSVLAANPDAFKKILEAKGKTDNDLKQNQLSTQLQQWSEESSPFITDSYGTIETDSLGKPVLGSTKWKNLQNLYAQDPQAAIQYARKLLGKDSLKYSNAEIEQAIAQRNLQESVSAADDATMKRIEEQADQLTTTLTRSLQQDQLGILLEPNGQATAKSFGIDEKEWSNIAPSLQNTATKLLREKGLEDTADNRALAMQAAYSGLRSATEGKKWHQILQGETSITEALNTVEAGISKKFDELHAKYKLAMPYIKALRTPGSIIHGDTIKRYLAIAKGAGIQTGQPALKQFYAMIGQKIEEDLGPQNAYGFGEGESLGLQTQLNSFLANGQTKPFDLQGDLETKKQLETARIMQEAQENALPSIRSSYGDLSTIGRYSYPVLTKVREQLTPEDIARGYGEKIDEIRAEQLFPLDQEVKNPESTFKKILENSTSEQSKLFLKQISKATEGKLREEFIQYQQKITKKYLQLKNKKALSSDEMRTFKEIEKLFQASFTILQEYMPKDLNIDEEDEEFSLN